jgi:ribosomal protein S18 acetylase RimI-like enzyme
LLPRSTPRAPFIDLRQRPELTSAVLAAFSAHPPGKHHLVNGIPQRMGLPPTGSDLTACLTVLVAASAMAIHAAIGLVPYSDEQATVWGPTATEGYHDPAVRDLMTAAKTVLAQAGYHSVRALADTRNRELKAFLLSCGFVAWQDNLLMERTLSAGDEHTTTVDLAARRQAGTVQGLFAQAFPEAGHDPAGYRHYVLEQDGMVVAAAAVRPGGRRSWLKLIAVDPDARGRGLAGRLLAGVCHHERVAGAMTIALEVLADNRAALALYARSGFQRQWAATIMTAPL